MGRSTFDLTGPDPSRATGARFRTLWKACASACGRLTWLRGLAIAGGLLLALAVVRPLARPAPGLMVTVETAMTLVALTAAGLIGMQFAQTRRLRHLLLFAALLMLALAELVGGAVPSVLHAYFGRGFIAGLPLAQLFVAATFAAAAFTPSDRLIAEDPRRPIAIAAAASVAAFAAAELGGLLLDGQLLAGLRNHELGIDRVLQHPLGLVVLLATVAFLIYAAIEFARRGRTERSTFLSLIAAGVLLLAIERLYQLRLTGNSINAITYRELFRGSALVLFLLAAVRADLQLRAALSRAAAMAERHRVAQDLHDGLAQDLALIAAHGVRMAQELGGDHPVAVAAQRALAVSRQTITSLSDMSAIPPGQALEAIAHELGDRFGVGIAVDAQPDTPLAPDATDHVARIAREAIANAARHGGARNIVVSLKRTELGLALRVCDDGCGIRGRGPSASAEGFGLRNMHERAAALGGQLMVRDRKSGGTELEVVLP